MEEEVDEKKQDDSERRAKRDTDICTRYLSGLSLEECGKQAGLETQRVRQILKKAGVWKPPTRSRRTKFLGVSVSESTKDGLKQKADQEGVSVSKLASNALDALVKPE